ncbi:hypothetical protein RirG_066890 [Rhizophagus irregularis DAOM 197198w]|uniref:Uncharacterized protein n=1 Tax=Rhizophagus irregularis (strain DAOM 197198w) TaxID=1432141 RepID=A0A015KYM9_RHIIW|nr:hypothetical protein RirG_066890 [Rhizophagus irregularis DAOM 197198w]
MGSEMPQQFDDVLTELLIDKINLWFKTFKLNPSYVETKVSREVLVEHIQRHVIQPNKINNAAKELLNAWNDLIGRKVEKGGHEIYSLLII